MSYPHESLIGIGGLISIHLIYIITLLSFAIFLFCLDALLGTYRLFYFSPFMLRAMRLRA